MSDSGEEGLNQHNFPLFYFFLENGSKGMNFGEKESDDDFLKIWQRDASNWPLGCVRLSSHRLRNFSLEKYRLLFWTKWIVFTHCLKKFQWTQSEWTIENENLMRPALAKPTWWNILPSIKSPVGLINWRY